MPGGQGAFTVEQPSFSGSFTAPGTPTTVELRVTANADWANGQPGGQTVNAGPQNFPTDCGGPNPVHVIDVCAEGGIAETLTNPGGSEAADFTVNGTPYTVEPDQQVVHVVPVEENGTVQVTVVAEGTMLFDEAVRRDCLTPVTSVAGADECAEGGISVTLVYDGDDTADLLPAGIGLLTIGRLLVAGSRRGRGRRRRG